MASLLYAQHHEYRKMTPKEIASGFDRRTSLERMANEHFDVLVIGGGITGAGVALEAATRGLKVALVEAADFASGTSSKSSKLVHGGLRYLQQGDVSLVRESLTERQHLLKNAPHLVHPLAFIVPVYANGKLPVIATELVISAALWSYDLIGGVREKELHRRLTSAEIAGHFPALRADHLKGGYLYHDAQADDARLTLEILRTAAQRFEVSIANYAPVRSLLKTTSETTKGVTVEVLDPHRPEMPSTGTTIEINANCVVNATGVWVDTVQTMDSELEAPSIRPAKGVHICVPRQSIPCDAACVLQVPGDRRSIFVIPWGMHVYIGTTDTSYTGPLDDPSCDPSDIDYLLKAVNHYMESNLSTDQITGCWSGIRPLVAGSYKGALSDKRTSDLSRRHRITVSRSGLITVTGGKLTTYRKMAEDTVAAVVNYLGTGGTKSITSKLPLLGAKVNGDIFISTDTAISPQLRTHLVDRYGSEAAKVWGLARSSLELMVPLINGLPEIAAEAVYAVRHEMAQTIEDVLIRRTRIALLDTRKAVEAAEGIALLLSKEWGITEGQARSEAARFKDLQVRSWTASGLAW